MFDSIFPKHWTTLQRLMWLKTNALARAVYEIVTGNPVTFSAKAAPLRQLKVAFSPVQSLNGYDAPWPAGGGANKMPPLVAGTYTSEQGLTCVVSENGTMTITGTATSGGQAFAIPFAEPLILKSGMYVHQNSTGESGVYDVIRLKTNADGTGDNSAWTVYPGYAGDANKAVPDGDDGKEYKCLYYYINTQNTERNIILRPSIDYTATAPTAWTPYSNLCPISGWSSLTVYHSGADTSNPQTISINLGSTVYSGFVDVISGVGEITHRGRTFSEFVWTYDSQYTRFRATISDVKKINAARTVELMCSAYLPIYDGRAVGDIPNNAAYFGATAQAQSFYVKTDAYTDPTAFANAMGSVQVVYPLQTPIPIQLTPQEVQSLLGENVMWASSNGDMTVTYRSN